MNSEQKRSVTLVQTAIADYRDHFVRLLVETLPFVDVQIGDVYFEESTKSSPLVRSLRQVSVIDNNFMLGRRFCWQRLHWARIFQSDVLVGELNPRLLSTWILLLLRKCLRKRTVLWGHAWSRAGAGSRTEAVRHLMRRLSDGLILYTNQQRSELVEKYPDLQGRLFVAPNSLYLRSQMESARDERVPSDFVYVGRIVSSKKVRLLVDAFAIFSRSHPESCLHLVGDGDDLATLRDVVEIQGLSNVNFYGHVTDLDRLKSFYATSVASVSPGYVGLSITQSFSFGVPMIVSKDEPHSPELESLKEGFNGSFFATDDVSDLCVEMERWFAKRVHAPALSVSIVEHCRNEYSVERMVKGFCKALGV